MEQTHAQPTLILLRGLSREQRHWGNFTTILQTRLPHYQVICLDTLGNGSCNQLASPLSIASYSQDILAKLAKQNIHKAVLVGLSLGGMVALEAIASETQLVSQVIAINSSSRHSWFWQRFALGRAGKTLITSPRHQGYSKIEQAVLTLTSLHHKQDLTTLKYWSELRRDKPTSIANGLRQIIAAARFKAPIQALKGKSVSFIYAKQDELVDPRCTTTLAKQLDAQVYEIDQAGHDVALDQPNVLADTIAQIIRNGG